MYSIVMGILLYIIFRYQLLSMLFYLMIAEMCIYIMFKKFKYEYTPFVRIFYAISLLLGYFSGAMLYGLDYKDPNIPNNFLN